MPDTPEPIEEHSEVFYLVKRPAYQLVLTRPTSARAWPRAWGALLRLGFIHEGQTSEIVLDLFELEDFHHDLMCLWDYVERERARHRPSS
jgi:hypothetical protein